MLTIRIEVVKIDYERCIRSFLYNSSIGNSKKEG